MKQTMWPALLALLAAGIPAGASAQAGSKEPA